MGRFHVRTFQAAAAGFEVPDLNKYPVYVNKAEGGLSEKLADKLRGRGIEAIVVDSVPSTARNVVYLGVTGEQSPVGQVLGVNKEAFATARKVAERMEAEGGFFLTVQSTGGDFGISGRSGNQVWSAGLAALAKTAGREWPRAFVKALDLDFTLSVEKMAECICGELCSGGPEKETGYLADGTRITVGLEETVRKQGAEPGLAPWDTLLVSGGARGVTADALLALAKRIPLRFILVGRTPLAEEAGEFSGDEDEKQLTKLLFERALRDGEKPVPMELKKEARRLTAAREIRQTILQLRQAGSEAWYLSADITDEEALGQALLPVREKWGAIRGIVHGAGILADKRIKDKKDEQFRQVFLTKVKGLQTLLNITQEDDLKLIACFSSVAAREGSIGQCDYAMANEIINKAAQQQKKARGNILVKSFNWGPWEGGMVDAALKKHFASRGIALIPREEGAGFFAEEVCGVNAGEVEVVIGMVSPGSTSLLSES